MNPQPDQSKKKWTSYVACYSCKASGMQDYGMTIGTCSVCNGNCFIRARDSKGRFVRGITFVSHKGSFLSNVVEPSM